MVISKSKAFISVSIDKDVKKLLKKYSDDLELNISKLAVILIYVALDDAKILKKTKITKLVVPFRNLLDSVPGYKRMVDEKIAKAKKNYVPISVIIDAEVKVIMEEIASEIGLPLKTFARNLIYVGLDDFKLLEKTGLIRTAVAFRGFLDSFQNYDPSKDNRVMNH